MACAASFRSCEPVVTSEVRHVVAWYAFIAPCAGFSVVCIHRMSSIVGCVRAAIFDPRHPVQLYALQWRPRLRGILILVLVHHHCFRRSLMCPRPTFPDAPVSKTSQNSYSAPRSVRSVNIYHRQRDAAHRLTDSQVLSPFPYFSFGCFVCCSRSHLSQRQLGSLRAESMTRVLLSF